MSKNRIEKEVLPRIYNINKPQNMTSHDVVYKVRKIIGTKKVGHTGTLDPDATGVLPICVGRATKIADLILNKDKSYICDMTIGINTDTYDSSGKILDKYDVSNISKEDVISAVNKQIGTIDQYPPVYSALKVNGKKMCDLARAGRADEIEVKPRRVKIHSIKINSIEKSSFKGIDTIDVNMEVNCSKGTYIRSICHDVGKSLGVGGMMSGLVRSKSGVFTLDQSITLDELEILKDSENLESVAYTVEDVLKDFKMVKLRKDAVKYYANGGRVEDRRFIESTISKDFVSILKNIKKENHTDNKEKCGESCAEVELDESKVRSLVDDSFDLARVYSNEGVFIGIGKLFIDNNILYIKSEKIFNLSFS